MINPSVEIALIELRQAAQTANISEDDAIAAYRQIHQENFIAALPCLKQVTWYIDKTGMLPRNLQQISILQHTEHLSQSLQVLGNAATQAAQEIANAFRQFGEDLGKTQQFQCFSCKSYIGQSFEGEQGCNYIHCSIYPLKKPDGMCPDRTPQNQ